MSDIYDSVKALKTKSDILATQKVARFSYTDTAYANDDAAGVESYNSAAEQNVPVATKTDFNDTVLDKGLRSQASSMTRNGMNHFFGRASYNLNKLVDWFSSFLSSFLRSQARDGIRYSPTAPYLQYDLCSFLDESSGKKIRYFLRVSNTPVELTGAAPLIDGVINTTHWEEYLNGQKVDLPAICRTRGQITTLTGPSKVDFNRAVLDDVAEKITYDSTNRRFYVAESGNYHITLDALGYTGAVATELVIGLNDDAPTRATAIAGIYSNESSYKPMPAVATLFMNSGDYITIYLVQGILHGEVGANGFTQITMHKLEGVQGTKGDSGETTATGANGDFNVPGKLTINGCTIEYNAVNGSLDFTVA